MTDSLEDEMGKMIWEEDRDQSQRRYNSLAPAQTVNMNFKPKNKACTYQNVFIATLILDQVNKKANEIAVDPKRQTKQARLFQCRRIECGCRNALVPHKRQVAVSGKGCSGFFQETTGTIIWSLPCPQVVHARKLAWIGSQSTSRLWQATFTGLLKWELPQQFAPEEVVSARTLSLGFASSMASLDSTDGQVNVTKEVLNNVFEDGMSKKLKMCIY